MHIARDVREKVSLLEKQARVYRADANGASALAAHYRRELRKLFPRLGFREKYLRGRFGGDKNLLSRIGRHEEDILRCGEEMREARKKAEDAEKQIGEAIAAFLMRNDEAFRRLALRRNALHEVKLAADAYIEKINFALDEVGGPYTARLASSFKSADIEYAVKLTKDSKRPYVRALAKYNCFLSELTDDAENEYEPLDLALDTTFDGFDFSSLSASGDSALVVTKLHELRRRVARTKRIVDEAYHAARGGTLRRIAGIRQACNK